MRLTVEDTKVVKELVCTIEQSNCSMEFGKLVINIMIAL